METTILKQSAPKPNAINPPTQRWFTSNLIKIGPLASEIFFFEIVDDDADDDDDADGRRTPAYPVPLAQASVYVLFALFNCSSGG